MSTDTPTTPDPIRSLQGKYGAHISWANTTDRSARTAPARAALDQKFLDMAGGDPIKAEHQRKAYFAELSMRSAQARRKAREAADEAAAIATELLEGGGRDDDVA